MRKAPKRIGKPSHDRAIFEVLHAISDMKSAHVAKRSGLSPTTIANWRKGWKNGGTRFPQRWALAAVAAVAGLEWQLVPKVEVERRRPASSETRATH